ncbi:MAG: hypothetical protein ACK40G_10285 [Cytophagaceae bacterium]
MENLNYSSADVPQQNIFEYRRQLYNSFISENDPLKKEELKNLMDSLDRKIGIQSDSSFVYDEF